MGQSASKGEGECNVPLGQDPRAFALSKVHGVPLQKRYLNMYPTYTRAMACRDLRSWRAGSAAPHAVVPYHKILKSHDGDARAYVFKKVYKMSPAEIAEMKHEGHYTKDMALDEILYQQKRTPGSKPFRYSPSRSMQFTNAVHPEHFTYKKGRRGYSTGYSYDPSASTPFAVPQISNPKTTKSHEAVAREAYARGLSEGRSSVSPKSVKSVKSPFAMQPAVQSPFTLPTRTSGSTMLSPSAPSAPTSFVFSAPATSGTSVRASSVRRSSSVRRGSSSHKKNFSTSSLLGSVGHVGSSRSVRSVRSRASTLPTSPTLHYQSGVGHSQNGVGHSQSGVGHSQSGVGHSQSGKRKRN